jgi:beta-phosphoglucomutase-like phosphatase (HAD superfamily)
MMRTNATGHCALDDSAYNITLVIFGVETIIDIAPASAAAWKTVFDPFLATYAAAHETGYVPFDPRVDYQRYIRGRPGLQGARDFLACRDIALPFDDLHGLATSQEDFLVGEIRRRGLGSFPSSIALVRALRRRGIRTAAVSVHRDATEMLRSAEAADLFDAVVGGLEAPGTERPEHPDVHLYLQAARQLNTPPGQTAVIEESAGGVAVAREGGFRAIIGLDRTGGSLALADHGADIVVDDLSQLRLHGADTR